MYRIAKVDDNQPQIVKALRDHGVFVQPIHTIGKGVPDLLCAYRGLWYVLEVKDGAKRPSARKLTPDEAAWIQAIAGRAPVHVVESLDQALQAVGVARTLVAASA